MKRFLIITTLMFLGGCSTTDTEPVAEKQSTVVTTDQKDKEMTQEQLNEKLKKEAVKADFVELNVDNPPKGKNVFAEGKVDVLTVNNVMDVFFLTTKEENGYGMYKINLLKTSSFNLEYEEGDQVRIYGGLSGRDEDGTLIITATIMEKVEGK